MYVCSKHFYFITFVTVSKLVYFKKYSGPLGFLLPSAYQIPFLRFFFFPSSVLVSDDTFAKVFQV